MKYMGSKNRYTKDILPIILKNRIPNQWYVEPFCGGCNIIDKVDGNRLANDSHHYLMAMWKALVNDNWQPPKFVSEKKYKHVQHNKEQYPPWEVGFIGVNSYGAKWFGGYRRDKIGKRNYSLEHWNNVIKQIPKLKGVVFQNQNYCDLTIPTNSIVYCDPPYANTTKYKDNFNHNLFWDWVRNISAQGHIVFVSEYKAPNDFECVWAKKVNNTLAKNTGSKQGIEKLFIYGN